MAEGSRWSLLNTLFLGGTLALALVLVPLKMVLQGVRPSEIAVLAVMFVLVGMAVTAGYHRLYSHRSYQASRPVELILLLLGAASFENSALKWSNDHRAHHRFVDDPEEDPYAIVRGFWFAHWIWVMEARNRPLHGVADLERNPLVAWQHRHHFVLGGLVALALPLTVGVLTGNLAGQLVMGLLLRIVLTHHSTFLINSAAHVFGTRPYTEANSARDNWLLAPLTFGEGYHNFHHMWQWDYRNSARWYQWDPTKWLLGALALAGLVGRMRRVPDTVIAQARISMEEKRLAADLAAAHPATSQPLRDRLGMARTRLDGALAAFQARREAWEATRRDRRHLRAEAWAAARAEWKVGCAQHREELRGAWSEWRAARLAARRWSFA